MYRSYLFFSPPAPTDIYTLSLHDALPILCSLDRRDAADDERPCSQQQRSEEQDQPAEEVGEQRAEVVGEDEVTERPDQQRDRKSTRLSSSHVEISYAVFCLKKKKKKKKHR